MKDSYIKVAEVTESGVVIWYTQNGYQTSSSQGLAPKLGSGLKGVDDGGKTGDFA